MWMVATAAAAAAVVQLSPGPEPAVRPSCAPSSRRWTKEKKRDRGTFLENALQNAVLRFHKLVKSRRVILNDSEKYFRRFSLRA